MLVAFAALYCLTQSFTAIHFIATPHVYTRGGLLEIDSPSVTTSADEPSATPVVKSEIPGSDHDHHCRFEASLSAPKITAIAEFSVAIAETSSSPGVIIQTPSATSEIYRLAPKNSPPSA